MRIRFPRRAGVLVGAIALASGGLTLTSCTPPPPPICHGFNFGINEHDSTGAGNNHLHVTANICVDDSGNVTSSTGSNSASPYGFLNFFGNVVDAKPIWAAGNSGLSNAPNIKGWDNGTQFSFTAVWDIHLGYTISGIGLAGDKGLCTATWPVIVTSGGGTTASDVVINLAKAHGSCHNGFFLSYST